MRLSERPLFSAGAIAARVTELAEAVSRDCAGEPVVATVVLKGALFFAADLLRQLSVPVTLDFVRARSYAGCNSTGHVTLTLTPEQDLRDRRVLIIEDILDTGRTSAAIVDYLRTAGASDIMMCALFDKPSRREVAVHPAHTGFVVDDRFLVGYGLDYEQRYRELPDVYELLGPEV